MKASVFYDERCDVFRARDEGGRVFADGDGNQLAFEVRSEAEDMLERRATLFSIPPRKLGAIR
ncbi:hypothetical protein [Streptacidiphilus sp. MAP5-3]|uniref:hypothetical protein n=1 Tax=unclassified Streptacidiphilus TaxID=2643834 RepID=UPI0035194F42